MQPSSRGDDRGAATTILVIGMALVLVAATFIVNRLAHANDLRTKAQTAADSAALSAETPLRRQAVDFMLSGIDPGGVGYWILGGTEDTPTREARKYAGLNDGELTAKVHLTGLLGHTAKADVATRECQFVEKSDDPKAPECTGRTGTKVKGKGARGRATAIARLDLPLCAYDFLPGTGDPAGSPALMRLRCDGVQVWPGGDRGRVSRLVHVRLVDKEDPTPYSGGIYSPGYDGPISNLPPNTPDLIKKVLAYAYAQLGTPYVYGGSCTAPKMYPAPTNCDCSSLAQQAYLHAGIPLPRTADTQYWHGPRVVPGQEQPGDLVFFDYHPGMSGPGHVGIVVDPEKKIFIEAPHTGDVVKFAHYGPGYPPVGFTRPAAGRQA
ncbi:NlpC/P60 family protein [Actinomadura sp. DC4]|uniref:NlpC/P60 family protein n=1 Tax=Actinomadura sp. DC4 TaxID=3055069 RepID=UPI0025B259BB|nr:NlpC/P60 family protein [Actinomadura sp. DC4]MDN3356883.1 NlpC/P60 family protein [Actinomadura sp. DC4]